MIPDELFGNLVQLLQKHPLYYHHFGPTWWRLKRMLKAAGYGPAALIHLGDSFEDPAAEHAWDALDDAEFMRTIVLPNQLHNVQFRHFSSVTTWPDGVPELETTEYRLSDPDVEI